LFFLKRGGGNGRTTVEIVRLKKAGVITKGGGGNTKERTEGG